jgi:hypothetical protein
MSVLLLQMAHAKDVEDLVGLDGALPEAAEVNPMPSSDAVEGTSATPSPHAAGEGPAPAPAPTSEGDLKVVAKATAEPTTEDPTARLCPRRWRISVGEFVSFVCVILNLGCCADSWVWACARNRY